LGVYGREPPDRVGLLPGGNDWLPPDGHDLWQARVSEWEYGYSCIAMTRAPFTYPYNCSVIS